MSAKSTKAIPIEEQIVADRIEDISHPAECDSLIGHDEATSHLMKQYASGRMHHAWILNGPRGIGKATFALRFTAHIFKFPNSDGVPQQWVGADEMASINAQLAAGGHPNLLHLTRPWDFKEKKFKTRLTVNEVRQTVPFFGTSRGQKGWRVAIIDSVDEMNTSAANALLKILEEPPDETIFFLIAHSMGKVSATIRSRCQTLSLKPLEESQLYTVLERLNVLDEINKEDHSLLYQLSGGSVRKAVLLIRNDGLDMYRQFEEICRNIEKPDWTIIHSLADMVALRGREDNYRMLLDVANEYIEQRATGKNGADCTISVLARWAKAWEKVRQSVSLAESYNLDKKQVIINLFEFMGEAARS